MSRADRMAYSTIHIEGGLLTRDLLGRIAAGDRELPGNRPEDYHLAVGERLGEAASRRWYYLLGAYRAFRERLATRSSASASASTLTRERWLLVLLDEFGFGRVPHVGRLVAGKGSQGSYPVSHAWGHVPIHLVSWDRDLDRRTGNGKQADRAPQSMMQELLNGSDHHLWGVLSNGRTLRILRDSTSLVGAAYIEFALESIFDGELYADFVPLFALLHVSRFELPSPAAGASTPADCWLERWHLLATATGVQAGDKLRHGVEKALEQLGTGFLEANPGLRDTLQRGPDRDGISAWEFRHELLRLAYQLIFLFVAECRGALLDPDPDIPPAARETYTTYFSMDRLRRIAERRRGDKHGDLWRGVVIVLDALGADGGKPQLALPELGGLYFRGGDAGSARARPDLLRDCELPNDRLLAAIRLVSETRDERNRRQRVDFAHLGAVELGSVYESLLELEARLNIRVPWFRLEPAKGNERKTTGTYFTAPPLIKALLDTVLDPVIEEHAASGIPADLLRITVCDPTCGSGQFLVAAARRLARRHAAMHTGDEEPGPAAVRVALGKVVRHCVYGVDVNPLAAELAKVSLWMESLVPGQPLAFLDAQIKVGNSLLGVTPKLLEGGIPDAAFTASSDDDPVVVRELRAANRKARDAGQFSMFGGGTVADATNVQLAERVRAIAQLRANTLADIRERARRYRALQDSPLKRRKTQVADAWCASFGWPKRADAPAAITTQTVRELDEGGDGGNGGVLPADSAALLDRLSARHRFFHWHLEYPEIFRVADDEAPDANPATGWQGGFSCVVGNPPWERVKLQEKEFFAAKGHDDIAGAAPAAVRKKLISALASSDDLVERELHREFHDALRKSAGQSQFLCGSGRYPLTGRGDVNTYAVFAETARSIIGPAGHAGLVLPTGIATDATTAPFFRDLVRNGKLASLLEFENEEFLLSRWVHHSSRFCLLTMFGRQLNASKVLFSFGSRRMSDVSARSFTLSLEEILLLNPNTGTTPVCRSRRDAEIILDIYRRVPVLWRERPEANPWQLSFLAMFHMANDSKLFHMANDSGLFHMANDSGLFHMASGSGGEAPHMLPLYEAKMVHHYDHRFGTFAGQTGAQANRGTLPRLTGAQHADPERVARPRYWVAEAEVEERLGDRWKKGWLLGWRDIARSSDGRTLVCAALPRVAVGHTFPLLLVSSARHAGLYANLCSFVLDFVTRQKIAGTHITYGHLKQLPVLPPERYDEAVSWLGDGSLAEWVEARVLELTYTATDMAPFARDLGDDGPPFVWDDERRFALRAELDAAYFQLYSVERANVEYIMDSFRAFQNSDPAQFARTKSRILEIHDLMLAASRTGNAYRTPLAPPPGEGPRHTVHWPSSGCPESPRDLP
jgi:hypothetical protein